MTINIKFVVKHFCVNHAFLWPVSSSLFSLYIRWHLAFRTHIFNYQQCTSPTHWTPAIPIITADDALLGITAMIWHTTRHPPNKIQMSLCQQTETDDGSTTAGMTQWNGRREKSIQPVLLWQSVAARCNPKRMTPRGERDEGRREGVQEEKALEERILTDHTKAAGGSTSEAELVCTQYPPGSLWRAV